MFVCLKGKDRKMNVFENIYVVYVIVCQGFDCVVVNDVNDWFGDVECMLVFE